MKIWITTLAVLFSPFVWAESYFSVTFEHSFQNPSLYGHPFSLSSEEEINAVYQVQRQLFGQVKDEVVLHNFIGRYTEVDVSRMDEIVRQELTYFLSNHLHSVGRVCQWLGALSPVRVKLRKVRVAELEKKPYVLEMKSEPNQRLFDLEPTEFHTLYSKVKAPVNFIIDEVTCEFQTPLNQEIK